MGVDGIISRTQSGTTGYLFHDAHGDTIAVYSASKSKLADYTYDAWGNQTAANSSTWSQANPIRYNGQYYDAESGMTYLRARYYQSEIQRFITEDPAKDGMNWYRYCGNNPVMYVDPSGLFSQGDENLDPVSVARIYVYTVLYYVAETCGQDSIKQLAANNSSNVRANASSGDHFHLASTTEAVTSKGEYDGWAIMNMFIISLGGVYERISMNAGNALGSIAGNMGDLISAITSDSSDSPSAEVVYFEKRFKELLETAAQNSAGLYASVVENENGAYIELTYEDDYNKVYFTERFLESSSMLTIIASAPI